MVASRHAPNIGRPLTMGLIGTTLGWSRPSNTSAAKPFPWQSQVVTANHTVNVLGVEIKNIHNFDETWMTVPLRYKKIKSGRKTANINTKKNFEVLSLLRPIVQ